MKPTRSIWTWLTVFMAMILAMMIYLLWRQPNHFLVKSIELLGLSDSVLIVQEYLGTYDAPDWIRYNVPDMLWMLSLTLLIMMIWEFQASLKSLLWVTMALVLALAYECLQLMSWIPGVFDQLDLLFILLGALPIFLLFIKSKHEHETSSNI